MEFEWDKQKATKNLQKHHVSFTEAATVFGDTLSVTAPDPDHSKEEDRFLIIGHSYQNHLLIVSFVERGNHIRIISARKLTRMEQKIYENESY